MSTFAWAKSRSLLVKLLSPRFGVFDSQQSNKTSSEQLNGLANNSTKTFLEAISKGGVWLS